MHNPYKTKLALLAASFVTAGTLSACNSNPTSAGEGGNATGNTPAVSNTNNTASRQPSVQPAGPEIAVNPAPPAPPPEPEPEITVNPAPPALVQ